MRRGLKEAWSKGASWLLIPAYGYSPEISLVFAQAYESYDGEHMKRKPSREELQRLPLTALAVFCQRIAERPDKYGEVAATEATNLKLQWTELQSLPAASVMQQKEVERKLSQLKKSMGKLLDEVL